MKKHTLNILFGCLWLVGLSACGRQPLLVIEGRLPDARYDGEVVYLVPLVGATAANVDSAYIREGAFRFEPEGGSIAILRTRPLLRLRFQELLVILEPGCLYVRLDSLSSAHGTALNDSLQQWKENKQRYDAKQLSDADYAQDTYLFVRRNRDNAAGRLVYRLSRPLFTPEQKDTLQIPDE
jgi:hypothetical protein